MADCRAQLHLIRCLVRCMSIILMSVHVTHGQGNCFQNMDLVIAVDTTSSQSTSSFDAVKAEVKGIVSGFNVGQDKTRLALISMSNAANVVANFRDVNSLSDFNAAVDRLTFSTGTVDLSGGIKVAKESVLNTARADKTSKILILVKDRRSGSSAVSDESVLTRVTSEAAAVKTLGAAIHAIGVGGLWSIMELKALFGSEYLLFINKNKALESVKSLNNKLCIAACPDKGKSSEKVGLCYKSGKQALKSVVVLNEPSSTLPQCAKEMTREFSSCSGKESCTAVDRKVSACNSGGKVTIENVWQSFDSKLQSCVTTKDVQTVDCKDALKCTGQLADVIFLVDLSGSLYFDIGAVREAVIILIQSLTVGADHVRAGIVAFSNDASTIHRMEPTGTIASLTAAADSLMVTPNGLTYTNLGLKLARETFMSNGRSGVPKFLLLFTDGASTNKAETFSETALIKNDGVTLYVFGIGKKLAESELRTMAAPLADTNVILAHDVSKLTSFAETFSRKMCIELSAPHPKMCDDNVFSISISECTGGRQQVTRTDYAYDSARKCVKSIKSTIENSCRETCTDPINGNEYFIGAKWTSLCHDFQCSNANPLVPEKTKCFAADGSCKDVGSPPFACRDEAGAEKSNCHCVLKNGKVTMVMPPN